MNDTDREALIDMLLPISLGGYESHGDYIGVLIYWILNAQRPEGGPYLIDARRLTRIGMVGNEKDTVHREIPVCAEAHCQPVFLLAPLDGEPA